MASTCGCLQAHYGRKQSEEEAGEARRAHQEGQAAN